MRWPALRLTLLAVAVFGCGLRNDPSPPAPTVTSTVPTDGVISTQGPTPEPVAPAGVVLYRCDTIDFPLEVLLRPGIAEQAADPAAEALRQLIASSANDGFLPGTGWRRLGATATITEFANEGNQPGVVEGYLAVRLDWTGIRWSPFRWGGCLPRRAPAGGLESLVWWLPNGRPDPSATDLTVNVVAYQCQGSPPAEAILAPTIDIADRSLTISLTGPGAAAGDCPRGLPTLLNIPLPGPVGDRAPLDGSQFPPRDATTAPAWLGVVGG